MTPTPNTTYNESVPCASLPSTDEESDKSLELAMVMQQKLQPTQLNTKIYLFFRYGGSDDLTKPNGAPSRAKRLQKRPRNKQQPHLLTTAPAPMKKLSCP
ncbi:hypothetical protein Tco_0631144 [Tanacetum coccineum]